MDTCIIKYSNNSFGMSYFLKPHLKKIGYSGNILPIGWYLRIYCTICLLARDETGKYVHYVSAEINHFVCKI